MNGEGEGGRPTGREARRAATARRIVEAAQDEFGEHGYEGTTIRAIARRAGIDPALVLQHYGSKEALFKITIRLPPETPEPEVADHLADVIGLRLGPLPPETRVLVRSMLTAPAATAEMRRFLDERVDNLARSIGGEDAELRAALIVSGILGLTVAKHFLGLEALAEAPDDRVSEQATAWLTSAAEATEGRRR